MTRTAQQVCHVYGPRNQPLTADLVKDLLIAHCDLPLKKPKSEHVYNEHIDMDLRHKDDQVPPTNESLRQFTHSLEKSGCNPAILPLLTKLYGKPNCPIIKNDIENDDVINLNESGNKLTSANGILKEKVNTLCEQLGPECHAKATSTMFLLICLIARKKLTR